MTFPGDFSTQTADIQTLIDEIERTRNDEIELERANIGARLNRLSQAEEIIQVVKFNTQQGLSAIQDADIFEAASDFSNLQLALEGLLSSGARLNDLSLLDFL